MLKAALLAATMTVAGSAGQEAQRTPVCQSREACIAAANTDEGLRLLWDDFERSPDAGRNPNVFAALAQTGDRLRPFLLQRMARCRDSIGGDGMVAFHRGPCGSNVELLQAMQPPFPAWGTDGIVDIALNGRSEEVREVTARVLALSHHPAALVPIQRQLDGVVAEADRRDPAQRNAYGLLLTVADYGEAARSSGPAVAFFLDRRFDESVREAAVKAAGRVGDPVTVPGLIAQEPDLTDNWRLAMAVTESLGRLRAAEARPLLERLARDYWHKGVRDNATHALAALRGSTWFTRRERQPDEDGEDRPSAGSCSAADGRAVSLLQNPVGPLRWPARGIAEIQVTPIGEATAAALRRRVPVRQVQGFVRFAFPVRGGTLIGINGGEFGGGIVRLPDTGPPVVLGASGPSFAWRMGGKLFVVSGLQHMGIDEGGLQIVNLRTMRIERSILLPSSPYRLRALAGHVAIIDTGHGDVAVRENGELVDVERVPGCADE